MPKKICMANIKCLTLQRNNGGMDIVRRSLMPKTSLKTIPSSSGSEKRKTAIIHSFNRIIGIAHAVPVYPGPPAQCCPAGYFFARSAKQFAIESFQNISICLQV